MILKTKRMKIQPEACTKEEYEMNYSWEFIDGIEQATIDGIGSKNEPRRMHFKKGENYHDVIIDSICYLLNDEGKTIERIN